MAKIGIEIAQLHDDSITQWKAQGIQYVQSAFLGLVEKNHAFNYQLWHAEDRARREDKGHEFVYLAKREIDSFNQQRNNFMEAMDTWFFEQLHPSLSTDCPVHSETPGMMIDRLSILALKSYHMALQANRCDVTDTHRQTCQQKLHILHQQRHQLQACLDELLQDIQKQNRTFRVYHQFKMYNDPTLNPQLYGKVPSSA